MIGGPRCPGAALIVVLCAAGLPDVPPAKAAEKPAAPSVGRPGKSAEPAVVARVNGRPILLRDLEMAVQVHFAGRRAAQISLQELRAAREQILERLIDGELLYQSAPKGPGSITEADVDAEVRRQRERFGTPGDFTRALETNRVSEDEFREQIRRTLIVTRYVDREIAPRPTVTDEDLRRYYDQNPSEMVRPEASRVSQIMVRVPGGAPAEVRAAARRRIEEILAELRAGQDFAGMARRHSEGPEASLGGETGWIRRGGGAPPPIERAAFDLPIGQVSDVLETRLGLHLIKVTERRPGGPIPFEEAKEAIRARLAERSRDDKVRDYLTGLRDKARIDRRLPAAGTAPK